MKKKTISSATCMACFMALVGCVEDSTNMSDAAHAPRPGKETETLAPRSAVLPPRKSAPAQARGSEILSSQHSLVMALSEEEAAWLDRHGYPTAAELDALLTYDIDQLESATRNQKSEKAAALLGHRRLVEGDINGAWAAFSAGASLGSLYAMQQGAILGTQRITGLPVDELSQADSGNLGVMFAQLQVARMLGDHRAQALIDRYDDNFNWEYQGKHVLAQTAYYMDYYGEFSRARGERVRGPDPRPNADAWKRLQDDPDALVEVYTRGGDGP